MVDTLYELATRVTPWVALVAVIAYVAIYPEKAEKFAGWFLSLFNFGIKKLRQRSITSSIQGNINDFARSINRQVKGVMPYNLRLRFVQSVDRAEISPDKRMVIVRVRDTLQDDRNLVNAMMSFCSIGVVPQARRFLSEPMNSAINVTMTRKLLNGLKHYSALQYLYDEVIDILRSYGYQKAYLAARGGPPLDSPDSPDISESASIRMARQLASSIQERRAGTIGRVMEYDVPDDTGNRRKQILIEVTLA